MLITLRNSGADGIQYTPVINDGLMVDILNKISESNNGDSILSDRFLKFTELDSFIIKQGVEPTLLHLNVSEHGWGGEKELRYEIHLEIEKAHYRLLYYDGQKPGFFKKLFTLFYPEMAEKQIEELV